MWTRIHLVSPHCVCGLMSNWDASSNHVLDEYFDSLGPLSITQNLSRPKQKVNVIAVVNVVVVDVSNKQ